MDGATRWCRKETAHRSNRMKVVVAYSDHRESDGTGTRRRTHPNVSPMLSGNSDTGRDRPGRTPASPGRRALDHRARPTRRKPVSIGTRREAAEAGTAVSSGKQATGPGDRPATSGAVTGMDEACRRSRLARLPFGAGRRIEVRRQGGVDSNVGPSFRVRRFQERARASRNLMSCPRLSRMKESRDDRTQRYRPHHHAASA